MLLRLAPLLLLIVADGCALLSPPWGPETVFEASVRNSSENAMSANRPYAISWWRESALCYLVRDTHDASGRFREAGETRLRLMRDLYVQLQRKLESGQPELVPDGRWTNQNIHPDRAMALDRERLITESYWLAVEVAQASLANWGSNWALGWLEEVRPQEANAERFGVWQRAVAAMKGHENYSWTRVAASSNWRGFSGERVACWGPDGGQLLTRGSGGFRLWSVAGGTQLWRWPGKGEALGGAAVHPDKPWVALRVRVDKKQAIEVWDWHANRLIRRAMVDATPNPVAPVFAAHASWVLLPTVPPRAVDLAGGKDIAMPVAGLVPEAMGVLPAAPGALPIWLVAAGEKAYKWELVRDASVMSVDNRLVSEGRVDGRAVAVGTGGWLRLCGWDEKVVAWCDLPSGKVIWLADVSVAAGRWTSAQVSSDWSRVFMKDEETGNAYLYSLKTGSHRLCCDPRC